jgi:hypothetical protein
LENSDQSTSSTKEKTSDIVTFSFTFFCSIIFDVLLGGTGEYLINQIASTGSKELRTDGCPAGYYGFDAVVPVLIEVDVEVEVRTTQINDGKSIETEQNFKVPRNCLKSDRE